MLLILGLAQDQDLLLARSCSTLRGQSNRRVVSRPKINVIRSRRLAASSVSDVPGLLRQRVYHIAVHIGNISVVVVIGYHGALSISAGSIMLHYLLV